MLRVHPDTLFSANVAPTAGPGPATGDHHLDTPKGDGAVDDAGVNQGKGPQPRAAEDPGGDRLAVPWSPRWATGVQGKPGGVSSARHHWRAASPPQPLGSQGRKERPSACGSTSRSRTGCGCPDSWELGPRQQPSQWPCGPRPEVGTTA